MDIKVRGGFGVREGVIEHAGSSTTTHQHNFHHITYVRDPARIEKLASEEGPVVKSVDKPAGGWVLIEAGVWHRITALVDHCRYDCIYVHRAPDHSIVDEYDGWMPAYE